MSWFSSVVIAVLTAIFSAVVGGLIAARAVVWYRVSSFAERTAYDLATIRKWLEVFITRYFANQFKRSALPNGPKVVAGGSLSPRGDWRMPSDASATTWLGELDANVPEQ